MSSREFSEWIAYEQIQPGSPLREDIHAALICSVLANVNRTKGKKYKVDDFLLDFSEGKSGRPKTVKALKNKMMAAFKAMGANFVDGRGNNE